MAMKGNLTACETLRAKLAIPNTISGKSAYEIAKMLDPNNPNVVDEQTWIASLKGADGAQGEKGDKGDPGVGETFVVNITTNPAACDKTTSEIIAAHLEGKTLKCVMKNVGCLSTIYDIHITDEENLIGWVEFYIIDSFGTYLEAKRYLRIFSTRNSSAGIDFCNYFCYEDPFLPTIPSDDNDGKILGRVDRTTKWISPSELDGVGTTEVVHVSVSHTADGDVYTSDKTVAEILALHDSGKLIAIDLLDSGYHWYFSDGWVAVTSKDPYRGVLQFANHVMYFTAENWQTETDVFKSSLKEDVKITEVSSSNDITSSSPDGFYVVPSKALVSTHTEVDLSKMDAEGLIEEKVTETFDDETQKVTTKTTRLEFDAEGNPIKITDNDGNETVLTW